MLGVLGSDGVICQNCQIFGHPVRNLSSIEPYSLP
jgi:hypothetical protein